MIWQLRVGVKSDPTSINTTVSQIKAEFKKAWDDIEKSLNSWAEKWLKEIWNESKKTIKNIAWLNDKLDILRNKLKFADIWSKEFKKIQNEIKNTEKELSKVWDNTSKIWWLFKWLGWVIAWAFSVYAIWNFIKSTMQLASQLESAQLSFETLLWSQEKANQMLQDIDELASKTPFNKLGLTNTIQQLIWFWLEWDKALTTTKVLWDAISAVWKWQAELEWVSLAIWQIQAKWKLSTEELLQMAERWLPVYQIIQEQLWLTQKQMQDLWNQNIDAETAINAILTGLNEKFAWNMQKKAKTIEGIYSNIKDNIEIVMWKIWLSVADKTKSTLSAINVFFDDNKSSLIDLGSDILTFFFNTFSSIWEVVKTTFSAITEALGILTGEESKSASNSMQIWKKLFLFINMWFQAVLLILNTFIRTVFWTIKATWTAIGWLAWHTVQFVSGLVKTMANNIVDMINGVIKAINWVVKFLWWSALITPLEKFSTRSEEIALKNWKVWENTKEAFDLEWIAESNGKILWNMISNIEAYDTAVQVSWKSSWSVFDKINANLDSIKWSYWDVWKASSDSSDKSSKASKEAKEKTEELQDKVKDLKEEYNDYEKLIKKLDDSQNKYYENSIKYNEEIDDGIRKINNSLKEQETQYKKNIELIESERKQKIWETNSSTDEKIAERLLEIEKEKNDLQESLLKKQKDNPNANLNRWWGLSKESLKSIGSWDLWWITWDELLEVFEINEKIKKLTDEELEAKKLVNEEVLKSKRIYQDSTELQRILIDQQEEISKINAEQDDKAKEALEKYEKEKQSLQDFKNIYEAFQNNKKLTTEELEKALADERFQRLSQEEQDLIIKLAKEKISLTEQKDFILWLEDEINQAKIDLSKNTTEILKADVSSLSNDYKKLIWEIQTAISKQRELNLLRNSSSNTQWFAEGWYTGDGWKYEPAGIVHKWEYVVPQSVISKMPEIVPKLENLRQWWSVSNDYSKKIDVWAITVQSQVDLELFFDKLKFKL